MILGRTAQKKIFLQYVVYLYLWVSIGFYYIRAGTSYALLLTC